MEFVVFFLVGAGIFAFLYAVYWIISVIIGISIGTIALVIDTIFEWFYYKSSSKIFALLYIAEKQKESGDRYGSALTTKKIKKLISKHKSQYKKNTLIKNEKDYGIFIHIVKSAIQMRYNYLHTPIYLKK